jgi:glycosyltransferase involved in cell wall biosynthesis
MEGGLRTRSGYIKHSTKELPLVSIVTVVLNGDRYLEQTILSVINQTYKNIEYIIIDGGSTDQTLEVIAGYEDKIDYWRSEADAGIYDAMNKGVFLAGGELISLLNADDFFEPAAVERVVEKYQSNAFPQILFGDAYNINENLNLRYKSHGHLSYWRGMCFSHQAMFAHRDIYQTIGNYDTSLRFAGDYDFVVKAITKGVYFSHVHAALVNYRTSGLSSQDQIASMVEWREVLKRYVNPLHWKHLFLSMLLVKSKLLITLLRALEKAFGPRCAKRLSAWYYKKVIAEDYEPLW